MSSGYLLWFRKRDVLEGKSLAEEMTIGKKISHEDCKDEKVELILN